MARKPAKKPDEKPGINPVSDPEENGGSVGGFVYWFPQAQEGDIIVLHRMDDRDKRWVYIRKLEPNEGYDQFLADVCGGGRYRAQLVRQHPESGKGVIVGTNSQIHINGPFKPQQASAPLRAPAVPPGQGTAVVETAPGPMDAATAAGVSQLLKGWQDFTQAALHQPKSTGPDILTVVEKLTPLVTALIGTLKRDPQAEETRWRLLVAEMKDAMKVTNPAPAMSLKDITGTMKDVLDLRQRVRDDDEEARGGSGDLLEDMVRMLGPKIVEIVQQEQRLRGMAVTPAGDIIKRIAPSPAVPALAAPPVPAVPATQPGEGGGDMLAKWLQARRPVLQRAAARAVHPAAVAEVEWGMLPDEYRGMVREFLAREDAEALVRAAIPEASSYATWYGEFFEMLRQFALPEQYEDDTGAGPQATPGPPAEEE